MVRWHRLSLSCHPYCSVPVCSIHKTKWIRYIKLIYLLNGWYCQSGWIVISQMSRSMCNVFELCFTKMCGMLVNRFIEWYCLNNSTESEKKAVCSSFFQISSKSDTVRNAHPISLWHCICFFLPVKHWQCDDGHSCVCVYCVHCRCNSLTMRCIKIHSLLYKLSCMS